MQMCLVHDSLIDALREVVNALGGIKSVAPRMRPAKSHDAACTWLKDCLNPDRREELHSDDIIWLLREGRRAGAHGAMAFLSSECGYAAPQPVDPADEVAELQRQFIETAKAQQRMLDRLAMLGAVNLRAVA